MVDEVEERLVESLKQLKEIEVKEDQKRERKFWPKMDVPLTLSAGLEMLTKQELDDIRKRMEIENVSHLKKAELRTLLGERIPEDYEKVCLLWDSERFDMLVKMARNGGYLEAPALEAEQIDYLRATGFVFSGTFRGKKVLAVPQELIESLLSLAENPEVKARVRKNMEWIQLTCGLLYYYGTLRLAQLEEMLPAYTNEPISIWEYIKVMHEANAYYETLHIGEDGYSNGRVFDAKRVKQEHQKRPDLNFYPFTKTQLMKAGEPDFVERNKSYLQLMNFIT